MAVLLLAGCAETVALRAHVVMDMHPGDGWYDYRGHSLGLTAEEARARDRGLTEDEPPDGIWDQQTAAEAAALWANLCAKCHGINGLLEEAPEKMDPPPREWGGVGAAMGFFFGGDKMRAGVYRKIRDGGQDHEDGQPSKMPAWGEALSREQMWALVFHIERL